MPNDLDIFLPSASTVLMRQAVEERKRKKRRALAITALLKLRRHIRPVTDTAIGRARRKGRA